MSGSKLIISRVVFLSLEEQTVKEEASEADQEDSRGGEESGASFSGDCRVNKVIFEVLVVIVIAFLFEFSLLAFFFKFQALEFLELIFESLVVSVSESSLDE